VRSKQYIDALIKETEKVSRKGGEQFSFLFKTTGRLFQYQLGDCFAF